LKKTSRPVEAIWGSGTTESGQALTEYIFLLATIVSAFLLILNLSRTLGVGSILQKSYAEPFQALYRTGDAKGRSFEDAKGPNRHARYQACSGCFRIFFNPDVYP
jgi:hypothetical protein